ncbi:MAG: hypothetical protein AVDCRST_MAG22-2939, partial [uncultured Rubrobacteraceae bacterium]
ACQALRPLCGLSGRLRGPDGRDLPPRTHL